MAHVHSHSQEDSDTVELKVSGMHCTTCAMGVYRNLEQKGLQDIYVNFSTDEVRFKNGEDLELSSIISGIEALGFTVEQEDTQQSFFSSVEHRFYVTLPFSFLLLAHMFLPFHWLHHPWIQFALCLPVVLLGWTFFGRSAFNSLRSGLPNMDVLIFIGFTAAFGYSTYGTLMHLGENFLFYETASTIITLVLLGNVLEKRSVNQTTSALRGLIDLQEVPAKRLRNGQVETVHAHDIVEEDLFLVNSGERIAADGLINEGIAQVDESMMTGESLPQTRKAGDRVIGGTLLVDGSISIRAEGVGKKSVLAQIIQLVKKAQSSHPPIQKLGDEVSAIFVPVVLMISFLTFLISYVWAGVALQPALLAAIAVLVISCPCAMGLATPTAVMVGIGRAAKKGILVKGGDTLERLSTVKTIIFDKTGTLTTGQFQLGELKVMGISEQEAKEVLLKLEQFSTHPIAVSICKAWKSYGSSRIFHQIHEEKGIGVSATDEHGVRWHAGSYAIAAEQSTENEHAVYLLKDGILVATVDMQDTLREGALDLIRSLKEQGLEPVLLSGDRLKKCEILAKELGIDTVYAEKLPDQKMLILEKYLQNGKVAMVGDGINDAPALARADVGISFGSATQIAIQSAGIVLLSENLQSVDEAIKIAKHTLKTIRQNLFWAFFYNAFAIPIAAFGFLNPMVGALSMAFSDVIVIGNSIRLKTKKLS